MPPSSCCYDVQCALKVSEILYEGITELKGLGGLQSWKKFAEETEERHLMKFMKF
jgi:hypothetical protein